MTTRACCRRLTPRYGRRLAASRHGRAADIFVSRRRYTEHDAEQPRLERGRQPFHIYPAFYDAYRRNTISRRRKPSFSRTLSLLDEPVTLIIVITPLSATLFYHIYIDFASYRDMNVALSRVI